MPDQDEVVLLLRRQSKGFARGPAKCRGVGVVKQRVSCLNRQLTASLERERGVNNTEGVQAPFRVSLLSLLRQVPPCVSALCCCCLQTPDMNPHRNLRKHQSASS